MHNVHMGKVLVFAIFVVGLNWATFEQDFVEECFLLHRTLCRRVVLDVDQKPALRRMKVQYMSLYSNLSFHALRRAKP